MPRGGGSRHSKNAGTMGVENMTYMEKRQLGFGTVKERLGKDTVKEFDACALGLTHAKDPVITPEGVLYDKEHILQCLLHQKKDIARKLKVYEGQEAKKQVKAVSDQHLAHEEHVAQFHRDNHGAGMYSEVDHGTAAAAGEVAGEGG
eukprot:CAMPEP_0181376690 /NCGR_PEP_ID=MMETSP1106-20121128/17452_1 /TAXON_ID=81844 /ORGANISM="Mantoniella antarctica, Strain SL-175" /LENGTH=146 /DNA_ID=CAMNT_0023495283 /DNA_START=60 /DNA_END=497 /DNA_ORIENTATION=+